MKQKERINRVLDNLRILRHRADPLLALTVAPSEHYNVVSLSFLMKMLGQANSIVQLRPRKDALLIARSMTEGYSILSWITRVKRQRNTRAKRYRALFQVGLLARYDQVIEGSKSRSKKRQYKKLRIKFAKQVAKQSKIVLKATEVTDILAGRPLSEKKDFLRRLTGNSLKDLFRLAEKQRGKIIQEAYRREYGHLSQYHHWEPVSVDTMRSEGCENISYEEENEDWYFRALCVAYVTLSETIKIVARAFRKEEIAVSLAAIDHSHLLLWTPEQLPDRSDGNPSLAIPFTGN